MESLVQKAERFDSLSFIAAGISHDLNNFIGGIMGNIELAVLSLEPGHPSQKNLDHAMDILSKTHDLTKQLNSVSKGTELSSELIDIEKLIRETATPYYRKKSCIKMNFEFDTKLPRIIANRTQMMQVIANLLINAIQSITGNGSIHLKCTTDVDFTQIPLQEDKSYLKFSVTDSGSGIDPEVLQHIFEPYYTTKKDGTGLGLAIVSSIIKKHGGYLQVSSGIGKGTTFEIYLPAQFE